MSIEGVDHMYKGKGATSFAIYIPSLLSTSSPVLLFLTVVKLVLYQYRPPRRLHTVFAIILSERTSSSNCW
jgi:hypothetical protein